MVESLFNKQRRHNFQLMLNDMNLNVCQGCERLTRADFCCDGCRSAKQGKYEIHEDGFLGHSESCNARYEQRRYKGV